MISRQEKILKAVIEEYSYSVKPVGSLSLFQNYNFGLSSPTIRNELAKLEKFGYLSHPHTSAGRIPTNKGFRYYVDKIAPKRKLNRNFAAKIKKRWIKDKEKDICRKRVIVAAEFCLNAVFGASREEIYYTGLSNLLREPEFSDNENAIRAVELLENISSNIFEMFNNLDELLNGKVRVFIGSEIPFPFLEGRDNPLGLIMHPSIFDENDKLLTMIIGPKRMDYQKNIGLLDFIDELES